VNAFPVQAAKVQPSPLRDDILARDRLLDWLHAKIHQRLVLVLAEAGYGKTTLLADFAGRTRLRTLWYRLDQDDRDWVTVLHHLVAAGREHDPDFAPRTTSLLSDTGVAGPSRESVIDAYLRELPAIAEHGLILILDDFHLVDESPDVKVIAKELVTRAPERVSIVIASRRTPTIPIARLRAAGEVAELRTDDLRFDADETARLFSETYGRPLEPDVLRDLTARTEGWAASLQLVQAALRDRSPLEIRRFVRNLTGADHELYDYLAEEVVGDLPDDLQQFLMRTSILQVVTPELAGIVSGLPTTEVRRLTTLAERYSLLSRRGSVQRDHLRYHPLVRDFLEDRLEREPGGRDAITVLHRAVAEATEVTDWRTACYHYSVIGDTAAIGRTIDASVEEIIARGDVSIAAAYVASAAGEDPTATQQVLICRAEFRSGQTAQALERAQALAKANANSPLILTTLAAIAFRVGDAELARETARALLHDADTVPGTELLGRAYLAIVEASVDADLRETTVHLSQLREFQHSRGHTHYEAITLLNLAVQLKVRGDSSAVLDYTELAMALLSDDPRGPELAATRAARSWALAHGGDLEAARRLIAHALADADALTRPEILLETAELELWYGSAERADDLIRMARPEVAISRSFAQFATVIEAMASIRGGRMDEAAEYMRGFRIGELDVVVGLKAQHLSVQAYWAVLTGSRTAPEQVMRARLHSEMQGADYWLQVSRLLDSCLEVSELNREIRRLATSEPVYLSVCAEAVVQRLHSLEADELRAVGNEIAVRPERWRSALRAAVDGTTPSAATAAEFLDLHGAAEDVVRLRRFSKRRGANHALGRALAGRVAPRVLVEDQGRVAIRIGDRHVEGTAIRRKVLTLLCYLLARPRFASTRDEVLEALWPEFAPAVALNSLNQTVYFLRRVFEPAYREDISPGYLHHEPDLIWLDRQLISARSQLCYDYIRSLGAAPTPDQVDRLVGMYRGPFALDFAYEEWAVVHRDALHAAYLQVVENSLAGDTGSGHWDRGIVTARRALAIDPEAEHIEASLVRLLRLSGAHAAAAEQYEHYSGMLRDSLGIEPPPLDAL
jgi:ATP/maltotriose-dependent transcriptional regulator MalT/DNA-binding SARP family transcriptional activator